MGQRFSIVVQHDILRAQASLADVDQSTYNQLIIQTRFRIEDGYSLNSFYVQPLIFSFFFHNPEYAPIWVLCIQTLYGIGFLRAIPSFCRFASRFGQRLRSQRVVCIVKLYCFEIFGGILAKCIELRSSNIGKWMLRHGYAPSIKKDLSEFDSKQFLMSLLDFFASPRLRVSA